MKKRITFPDWTKPAYMMISADKENEKRPVWGEYTLSEDDLLSLYATLEIKGGHFLFWRNTEAEERNENREEAWINALAFAEQLWRRGKHREFVVMFRPKNQDTGREAICIYRRLPPILLEKKVVK